MVSSNLEYVYFNIHHYRDHLFYGGPQRTHKLVNVVGPPLLTSMVDVIRGGGKRGGKEGGEEGEEEEVEVEEEEEGGTSCYQYYTYYSYYYH